MEPFSRDGAGSPGDLTEYRKLTFDGDDCPDGMDWRVVNWARGVARALPEYAVKVVVMKEMGWTDQEYRSQPQPVIDQVLMFLSSESQGHRMAQR